MERKMYKRAAYILGEWLLIAGFLFCTLFLYLSDYIIDAPGLTDKLFLETAVFWTVGGRRGWAPASLLLGIGSGIFAGIVVFWFHKKSRRTLFLLGYEIFFLFYGYANWRRLIMGFCLFINPWIKKLALYYERGLPVFVLPEIARAEALKAVLCFLGFLLFFMAPAVGRLVCWGRGKLLFLLCTVWALALKLSVGEIPQTAGFFIWGALFVVLLGTGRRERTEREHRERMKSVFFLAGSLCLFGFLLSRGLTPEFYEEKVNLKKAKAALQDTGAEWVKRAQDFSQSGNNPFSFGSQSSSGLSGGRLDRTGDLSYRGKTALRLSYLKNEYLLQPLFLKGYVGELYTGSQWKQSEAIRESEEYQRLEKEFQSQGGSAENQTAIPILAFGWPERKIRITNLDAGKGRLYMPYMALEPVWLDKDGYLCPSEGKAAGEYEASVLLESGMEGFWRVQNNFYLLPDDSYQRYEAAVKQYWKLANKVYLQVPEGSRLAAYIREDAKEKPKIVAAVKYGIIGEIITYVQKILKEQAAYSLSPGSVPSGKDFADYFFFENKKGYCMHFATAGVLMFRALGVPARYAEGYVVPAEAIRKAEASVELQALTEVSIPDKNAHAWVEVYQPGIGWMPVEVTPGYDIAGSGSGVRSLPEELENADKRAGEGVMEETAAPETAVPKPSVSPEETVRDEKEETKVPDTPSAEEETKAPAASESGKSGAVLKWLGRAAAGMLLAGLGISALIWLRRTLILYRKKKKLEQADAAGKIRIYYQEALRYLAYRGIFYKEEPVLEWGKKVEEALGEQGFQAFAALAFKAAFGKEISQEEETEARAYYLDFWKRVSQVSSGKEKKYFRYFKIFEGF